jgi:Ca2+-binding EF-hand superfamily protein
MRKSHITSSDPQKCREAFNTFDADGSGTIDTQEMRLLLEAIGENPTEEELTRFMAEVDEGGKGEIEFSEFLRAFEKQRGGQIDPQLLSEIVDSFVALGGNRDKSGCLDSSKLVHIVRDVFGMTIRVDKLVEELDLDKDGHISFNEYLNLFL